MEQTIFIAYLLACIAIVIVPGPSVTVIIANSLRAGSRAGLANVAGMQVGLFIMVAVLALGLETIITSLSYVFIYLKLVGAAYLIWLGYKLLCSDGTLAKVDSRVPTQHLSGYFWQGFWVVWANPKVLFFFGAFIPQFIDPSASAALQTFLLGLVFMVVATVLDSGYAIAAGKTKRLLAKNNVRILEKFSGCCLIGGGLWLAFSKRV